MDCVQLSQKDSPVQDSSAFVGGEPLLPHGTDWPKCRLCGDELVHFLDIELPSSTRIWQSGSRLQIFACREHDDIAGTIFTDYDRFASVSARKQLPDLYWDITDGHYLLRLLPPKTIVVPAAKESRLASRNLVRKPQKDSESNPLTGLKLFGYPAWLQNPESHRCCCGSPMELILQVPEGTGFEMSSCAPEQPNSFSSRQYCLFLGNALYLLACTAQCHPLALWPVLQN